MTSDSQIHPGDGVNVAAIEVVQSVQSADNRVQLVTNKRTFARVYLEPDSLPGGVRVHGHLVATRMSDGLGESIRARETLLLRGSAHPPVPDQRLVWSDSLNFELPAGITDTPGEVTLELKELVGPCGSLPLHASTAGPRTTVRFTQDPKLRCRVVVYRYRDRDGEGYVEPMQEDVDTARDFVTSAFPVAGVEWSVVYVDATRDFTALNRVNRRSETAAETADRRLTALLRQTMAIRNEDVAAGRDPRTLYLAMFGDETGRLGGAAVDSPDFPAPHIVAAAAVESSGQLAGHEIAHILGRRHPGIPSRKRHGPAIGQRKEDEKVRGYKGSIAEGAGEVPSNPLMRMVGLDTRDRSATPAVLHSSHWFDLMTYRYPKWVSEYTYESLYERLCEIDEKTDFLVDDSGNSEEPRAWTVIGQYNLGTGKARILHVLPTNYRTPEPAGSLDERVAVDWTLPNEAVTVHPVYVRRREASDLRRGFGLFQHTILGSTPPERIRIRINGAVVAVFSVRNLDDALDAIKAIEPDEPREDRSGVPRRRPRFMDADSEDARGELDGDVQDQDGGPAPPASTPSRPPGGKTPGGSGTGRRQEKLGWMFAYFPAQDIYEFRFAWPARRRDFLKLVPESKYPGGNRGITTIVQCRRPGVGGDSAPEPDRWETVAVTPRRAKRVWIDPVFLGRPRTASRLAGLEPSDRYDVEPRRQERLQVRILISNGIERRLVFESGRDGIAPDIAKHWDIDEFLEIVKRRDVNEFESLADPG